MSIEDIKCKLAPGLVENLINEPSAHYIHILLLRELQSSAIFTTNGQDADITTVGISASDGLVDYSPVMMFKRKQTGSDRRKGKELQRNLINVKDTMNVNEMNQESPESMLYGSAAGDEAISVTSRVMYDTDYSIRIQAFSLRRSSRMHLEMHSQRARQLLYESPILSCREPCFRAWLHCGMLPLRS